MKVVRKAKSVVKILSSPGTWSLVLSGGNRLSHPSGYEPPELRVGEADEATGLVPIEVDGRIFFQPASCDLDMLRTIHREINDSAHPHHYEYAGCAIRPGDVVFDVGSCEGFFIRFALARGARLVVAVEPFSIQCEALRRNFAGEIAEGRVRIEQRALSDRVGVAQLSIDPAHPWGAGLSAVYNACLAEEVRLDTLDAMAEEIGEGCDFIKADTEGAEGELLDGAMETLRSCHPRLAIAAYHRPSDYVDLRRRVLGLRTGYHVVAKGLFHRAGVPYPVMMHAW